MILFSAEQLQFQRRKSQFQRKSSKHILKNQKLLITTSNFYESKKIYRKYSANYKSKTEYDFRFNINNKTQRIKSSLQIKLSEALKIKQINKKLENNKGCFKQSNYSKSRLKFIDISQNQPKCQRAQNINPSYSQRKSIINKTSKENYKKEHRYLNLSVNSIKNMVFQSTQNQSNKLNQASPIFIGEIYCKSSNQQYLNFIKPFKKEAAHCLSQPTFNILQALNETQWQQNKLITDSKQCKNEENSLQFKINKFYLQNKEKKFKANKIRQKLKRRIIVKDQFKNYKNTLCRTKRQIQSQSANKQQIKHNTLYKNRSKEDINILNNQNKKKTKVIKRAFTHTLMISGSGCHKI